MLAANLPVCQYVSGMQNSNNGGTNNSTVGNPPVISNSNSNISNNSSSNITGPNSSNINNGAVANSVGIVGGGGTSAVAAKNQLEQLNTMREALFAQDGWGCQHVNQETNWEVPSSPEPTNKDSSGGPPIWKPNVNNGTDLWESNLRNGGQPPTQTVQKTPWGHTPSSNLGGTWGEDDDGADSSSVWAGGSSGNNPPTTGGVGVAAAGVNSSAGSNAGPQWTQSSVGVGVNSGGGSGAGTGAVNIASGGSVNSGGVNVPVGASTGSGATGNGWGDPRDIRSGPMGGPIDLRNVDPRDPMRATSAGDPRDLRMMDPRDPIRGDPRGISGRLNGNAELWGQHHPSMSHNQLQALNKMVGASGVGVAANAAQTVVSSGAVGGIGPGGVNTLSAPTATGNVSSQWGTPQSNVAGPKDIPSISGGGGGGNKQVTGWEEPSPPPQRRNLTNYDDGTSLWGGQQSRVPGGVGSHWKDIPDPMNRNHLIRNTMGNQGGPNAGVISGLNAAGASALVGGGQNVAPVTVGPSNPSNPMTCVTPQGRMIGGTVGPNIAHKPENSMWIHSNAGNVSGRNPGSWGDDGSHSVGVGSNWIDDKGNTNSMAAQLGSGNVGSVNAWNDSSASWNKNKLPGNAVGGGGGGGGWVTGTTACNVPNDSSDINSDWSASHPGMLVSKPQQKINVGGMGLNNEIIKQSKQYRMLVDGGFKKEDVERALIAANMNFEEAAEMLRTANAPIIMDSWRRQEENLSSYTDHANSSGGGGGNIFPGRYPSATTQPTMSFPPNNLLNNMTGAGVGANVNSPNLAALNSMQPLQKYLNQGGPHNLGGVGPQSVGAANVAFGQGATNVTTAAINAANNTNNQPSTQQLRMLVQQIQMAVQNGYLSNQILNQPLAPATLLLVNQLLSNIKHLQGAQQSVARGNNANNLQLNVAIAKYKQQIQNLQNQINTQQTMYVKQQQHQVLQQNPQQQHALTSVPHVGGGNAGEYLRAHDAINALQGNFSEMNMKSTGYQGAPNQQSRLNQWKLPVLEKDLTPDSTDFSRAPGATKQGNTMVSLGLQNDGTWSTARNIGDGWPDSTNDNENKDWSVSQNTAAAATYTDLVQEFEPGKPWKGSLIKSIEDDPSITPGSVARSPLSINPTPKESDIFATASKSSPTDLPTLGLTSSTWSFNPSTSNQNFSSWSDNNQPCATSDLWASSMNKTSRGPPPGLVGNKSGGMANVTSSSVINANASNGWLGGGGGGGGRVGVSGTNTVGWSGGGGNPNWNSSWLLLKNLTTQIDSSTLRTLCMQHGPLIAFHLYLNQGIALCKYATREEANKAQMTLNNCVLGNTTICAESPSDNDVQAILQHMPPNPLSTTPGTPGNNGGNGNSSQTTSNNQVTGGNNNNAANVNSASNIILNGSNSSSSAIASTNNGGNNAQVVGQSQIQNGSNSNGGGNSGNSCGNGTSNTNSNNPNTAAATWRQASSNQQQQQQQSNQTRPTAAGREADYDYISKFVCSIVDD